MMGDRMKNEALQGQPQLTDADVAQSFVAATLVLNGGGPEVILQQADKLVVARQLIAMVARGELVLRRLPQPAAPGPMPPNRKERRSAKHKA